jgi:hypothetical protein
MKTITFAISFLIVSFIGYGQEPSKGANLVIFESDSLKDFDLFKECIMILTSDGYSFDQLDKDFYLASTKPIKPKKVNLEYRIDLSVRSNKIEIRSYVKSLDTFSSFSSGLGHQSENAWERGANRSLSTSLWRYGWDKQIELTSKIKETISGSISYSIEQN